MTPPIWIGATPTGKQLERMTLEWFRNAVDQLHAATVPENYWRKVTARERGSSG